MSNVSLAGGMDQLGMEGFEQENRGKLKVSLTGGVLGKGVGLNSSRGKTLR